MQHLRNDLEINAEFIYYRPRTIIAIITNLTKNNNRILSFKIDKIEN